MANHNHSRYLILIALLAIPLLALPAGVRAQDDVDRAFARATQLHESGDIEGAIRGYQAILVSHPNRADVRSNLGAAYSRLGRYEEAIQQYQKALSLDSGNQPIRFNLAVAYYKAALFAEAAAELSGFVAVVPANVPERMNAVLLLADCQVRLGEYKKTIELLSPLADADPNNRTVAFLLGSAFVSDGQLNKGQLLIDRVFRDEDSAEARLLIGTILLVADDGQGAIKELERGIELNPRLPSLRAWYGRALMRMGDSEKAKAAFKSELTDNPNDFDANLYLGILLRQDKSYTEAFGYLSRAIHLRPRDQYARYHLGAVYVALGKSNDARPLLEGVVKEYPEFIEARVLLASVYYRLNRKEDGDHEQAIIEKLNAEQQNKQPGVQNGVKGNLSGKRPANPENNQNQQKERQ
jgi:tetratricopeptide (TPR) repeat protein